MGPLRGEPPAAPPPPSALSTLTVHLVPAPLRAPEPSLVPAAPQGFPTASLPRSFLLVTCRRLLCLTGRCPWRGASAFRVAAEADCRRQGCSRHGPGEGGLTAVSSSCCWFVSWGWVP